MHAIAPLQLLCKTYCMDDKAQWRNATIIAALTVLVTAASYWTGQSAVLLAGVLLALPPAREPTHPSFVKKVPEPMQALVVAAGQGVFVFLVGAALFAAARSLHARHRSQARREQGRLGKVASSAAALVNRNPMKKRPRPATSEEDRQRRAAAAQARCGHSSTPDCTQCGLFRGDASTHQLQ